MSLSTRRQLARCRQIGGAVNNVDNVNNVEIPIIKVLIAFRKHPYSRNKNLRKLNIRLVVNSVIDFFYFAFVLMLLRYCFAYRNRKRRDIIIILKIVKFNFLILTDTVVSRQTADVTLGGILQL
jgi:hypothetical protein